MTVPELDAVHRRLNLVRWVAWVDLLLLIALVVASRMGNRDLVRVLGPVHGINFLLLLVIVGTAALDGLWSWWFPAAVFVTGGPVGALVGEWFVGRRLAARAVTETNGATGTTTPHEWERQ